MRYLFLFAIAVLVGCGARGAVVSPSTSANAQTSAAASPAPDVEPVSMTASSGLAADGLLKCTVSAYADHVAGIGIVAHGNLVKDYVPLSGKEPELMTDHPVFVVQYSGTIRELSMGGPGSAAWIDIQNAVCAVIDGESYNYVSGPWVDSNGKTGSPPPAPYYTKTLPAPLP
jgi:hypothetical protein